MGKHQNSKKEKVSIHVSEAKGVRRSKPGIYEEDFDPEIYYQEFEREKQLLNLEARFGEKH